MKIPDQEAERRFAQAKETILHNIRQRDSIGVLSEKTIHAVVKNYLEPDPARQERQIGSYVADIYDGHEIMEIQTRSFRSLRDKLRLFLELCPVTVVYPIPAEKWLYWVDRESGERSGGRKSPKRGKPYDVFYELYQIKPYVLHPNFRLKLLLLSLEEYRFLDGWSRDRKKGSSRMDRAEEPFPIMISMA